MILVLASLLIKINHIYPDVLTFPFLIDMRRDGEFGRYNQIFVTNSLAPPFLLSFLEFCNG